MHLEALKKSLPDKFYIDWRDGKESSPIRIKLYPKYKEEASMTARNWVNIIAKLTEQKEENAGQNVLFRTKYRKTTIVIPYSLQGP